MLLAVDSSSFIANDSIEDFSLFQKEMFVVICGTFLSATHRNLALSPQSVCRVSYHMYSSKKKEYY